VELTDDLINRGIIKPLIIHARRSQRLRRILPQFRGHRELGRFYLP
jgi:hypothetical protein